MALYQLPNGKWVSDTIVPRGTDSDNAPRAQPVNQAPLPVPVATSVTLPTGVPTAEPAPTPSGPTLADKFDDHFKDSHLAGSGQDFVNAGYKYGIDPTLLASISSFETGAGTSRAARDYNNVGGMMNPRSTDSKGFMKFDSVQEGIDAMASNLKRNYIDKGLTTIPAIAAKYSPPGAANDPNQTNAEWPASVAMIQKKFGGGLGLMN
jgi:hypothetical protein